MIETRVTNENVYNVSIDKLLLFQPRSCLNETYSIYVFLSHQSICESSNDSYVKIEDLEVDTNVTFCIWP